MTIKETRIKHGLTIKQVSDLTGIPYRTLQNWEAGVRKCPDYVTTLTVEFLKNCLLLDDPEKYIQLYENAKKGEP